MTTTTPQVCSVSAAQLQQVQKSGADLAILLVALSEAEARNIRLDTVQLIDALTLSPRLAGMPDEVTGPEVRRIAERVAEILRATPSSQHSVIWVLFGAAVREDQEMLKFVAEWTIAWMGF